jgi:hypothetical protein
MAPLALKLQLYLGIFFLQFHYFSQFQLVDQVLDINAVELGRELLLKYILCICLSGNLVYGDLG